MKKLLHFLLITISLSSYSQEVPPPTNIIATVNKIYGNADPKTTVIVETEASGVKTIHTIVVNYKGYFEYTFNPSLTSQTKISIWTVDETGKALNPTLPVNIESSETILNKLSEGKIILPLKTPPTPVEPVKQSYINPLINEAQPISSTFRYKVKMLNTNFTIPIARFNLTESDGVTSKKGDILLFNSIGAGFGVSWGELEKTTDANGETINNEFTSTIGVHLGVLFSAGSNSTENKNVFAPTVSISFLDFQIGYGYEMGTLAEHQKKGFFTIAYAIPLSKLLKGKFYIFTASKGYNSKNPLLDSDSDERTSIQRFIQ